MRFAHAPDLGRNLRDVGDEVVLVLPIEMLADQAHVVGAGRQHLPAPIAHRADPDRLDRRIDRSHGMDHAVMLLDIFGQRHVPELPVAKHLVTHGPPFDAVRLGMPIPGPQLPLFGIGSAVDVLDLGGGLFDTPQARIDGDERFGVDLAA